MVSFHRYTHNIILWNLASKISSSNKAAKLSIRKRLSLELGEETAETINNTDVNAFSWNKTHYSKQLSLPSRDMTTDMSGLVGSDKSRSTRCRLETCQLHQSDRYSCHCTVSQWTGRWSSTPKKNNHRCTRSRPCYASRGCRQRNRNCPSASRMDLRSSRALKYDKGATKYMDDFRAKRYIAIT